jgi:hypothetical protein
MDQEVDDLLKGLFVEGIVTVLGVEIAMVGALIKDQSACVAGRATCGVPPLQPPP